MPRTPYASPTTAVVALIAVAAIVAVGALVSVTVAVWAAAALVVAAAVIRMTVPAGKSFSVRRRAVDVVMMATFAGALVFLALTTPLG